MPILGVVLQLVATVCTLNKCMRDNDSYVLTVFVMKKVSMIMMITYLVHVVGKMIVR